MKINLAIMGLILSSHVFAWESPSEAVSAYLKFELEGGRVFSEKRNDLIEKYSATPQNPETSKAYPILGIKDFTGLNLVETFSIDRVNCDLNQMCTVFIKITPPLNADAYKEYMRASKFGQKYFSENPNFINFPSMRSDWNERDSTIEIEMHAFKEKGDWKAFGSTDANVSLATFSKMIDRSAQN